VPGGRGEAVHPRGGDADEHLRRESGAGARGLHPGQRADPDARQLPRPPEQVSGRATDEPTGAHAPAVPSWVELADGEDLILDPARHESALHQLDHPFL
jgi:hypothetical protein